MTDLRTRFLAKFRVDETSGCWVWTSSIARPMGYARIWRDRRHVYAHRVSYELFKGPIPDGLTIDHLCRNRLCVNPDHLEAITNRENILRGECRAATNKRKTHCKRGHLLEGENVRIRPTGARQCKPCHRAWKRAKYAADRGKPEPELPLDEFAPAQVEAA